MNDLSPCLECALSCRHHDSPMCVSNLVMLADEHAPISLGLHVGLNHVYGEHGLPPCVRGSVGSAHWSILPPAGITRSGAASIEHGSANLRALSPLRA